MAQYKKGEDLEIYEMDFTTNTQLQEVCNAKQPVLFDFKKINPDIFIDLDITTFLKHSSCDIRLRDINDPIVSDPYDTIPLKYDSFRKLIGTDSRSHLITEENQDFIDESGLYSEYTELNTYLKPAWSVQQKYDLLQGSEGAYTPLRFHTDERQFYIISSGKVSIKMTPWKSRKYLHPIMDYSSYEFRSPVDPWNNQINERLGYMHDIDKLKFLEFDVVEGFILYIPPYWWYSIKYSEEPTMLSGFTYNSIMNCVANSPNWALYFLQQHNIKKKVTKTIDLSANEVLLEPKDSEEQEESKE